MYWLLVPWVVDVARFSGDLQNARFLIRIWQVWMTCWNGLFCDDCPFSFLICLISIVLDLLRVWRILRMRSIPAGGTSCVISAQAKSRSAKTSNLPCTAYEVERGPLQPLLWRMSRSVHFRSEEAPAWVQTNTNSSRYSSSSRKWTKKKREIQMLSLCKMSWQPSEHITGRPRFVLNFKITCFDLFDWQQFMRNKCTIRPRLAMSQMRAGWATDLCLWMKEQRRENWQLMQIVSKAGDKPYLTNIIKRYMSHQTSIFLILLIYLQDLANRMENSCIQDLDVYRQINKLKKLKQIPDDEVVAIYEAFLKNIITHRQVIEVTFISIHYLSTHHPL